MKRYRYLRIVFPVMVLTLAVLACGFGSSIATSIPQTPVAPLTISQGLGQIDVCQAVPVADIEAVMGHKLVSAPQAFDFYGTAGANGCMYDAGKDSRGAAYFGYVVFTPVEAYSSQPLYLEVAVAGIGEEAYFNNGADARQLWVKYNDQVAFVVGFGDDPREAGAQALAKLVLAALK